MKTVALIPARGGSKGVPGKNIREIAGKPLIQWSIDLALASESIDQVYVSTDSREIADIAVRCGALVPFMRPAEISGDLASTESAMLHFCDYMREQKEDFDVLVLLQATSPIRAPGRLDDALEKFRSGGFDSMLSVCESHRFFWKNPSAPEASYDFVNRPRRQDIRDADRQYMETGSIYITKREGLEKSKNRLCGTIGMYVTPEEESYEIDSALDFEICEVALKAAQGF